MVKPTNLNSEEVMTTEKPKDNKGTNYTLLILFSIIVILLYAVSWYFIDNIIVDVNERGLFGDKFGAVNALFSGLAFAGLIFTIILQKKELALQREELTDTRKELKGQKVQLEIQNETLKVQRFENTFFQMLSQFQIIVNNIAYSYKDTSGDVHNVNGREAFYDSFEVAVHHLNIEDWNPFNLNRPLIGMRDVIKTYGYKGYMESHSPTYFDHYFRFLYRILKFVETSPLVTDYDEEYKYTCMLRAMLSRYELVWLYYNGLSYGKDKLKPLIERYAMLNNLRGALLADQLNVFGKYEPSAWRKPGN